MGSQVRYLDPEQNQKAGVVGEEVKVAPPRRRTSTDEAVAAAQVTRRRTPCQTGHRPPLRPGHILEVLAHRLLIAQVMVMFHQAVEQWFVRRAPHLLELDGLELS